MKRNITILVILFCMLVTVACGTSTSSGAKDDSVPAQIFALEQQNSRLLQAKLTEAQGALNDMVVDNRELAADNTELRRQLIETNNTGRLIEEANKDGAAVRGIALWSVFAWDIRFAVLVFIALVVAFGVAFVIVLKQALAMQRDQNKREMDAMRDELRNELHEAQRLVKLWREAYKEAQEKVA
jgi:cell division protein FtsL